MGYTTIVIGAGSAGAIVAARLSEDPSRSVLLLEAGPDYPDFEALPADLKQGHATGMDLVVGGKHDWQYIAKASPIAPPMAIARGKVTGGTSAINGQVFLRGVPEDYDDWASWGNTEWSFQKLLPYFRKLETDLDFRDDFHGTDGPIIARRYKPNELMADQAAFVRACRDAGFPDSPDHNNPNSTGVGPMPLNNPNGIRWSTALGYLAPARHRLNFTIRANCHVHRVLFDGCRAIGVEVESGGQTFKVYGEEIILSAGAIVSPQLLMLSGVGPADHLRSFGIPVVQNLPGVGQNLRDHPCLDVLWRAKDEFPMPDEGVGPQKVALRYTAPGSKLRNDMTTVMRWRSVDRMLVMTAAIYLAKSAGEVRLTSADPHVQPYLDYNLMDHPYDRERLREGVRLNLRLGEHPAFRNILGEVVQPTPDDLSSDDALDTWLLRTAKSMGHISATCKMGPASDPMAVVDQYGRVHGIDSLRVADASIMPDCIRANTNVTAMMIGERIADFVKSSR